MNAVQQGIASPPEPCPICRAPYGFHEDPHPDPAVPDDLLIMTSKERRARDRDRRQAAYAAWRSTQPAAV